MKDSGITLGQILDLIDNNRESEEMVEIMDHNAEILDCTLPEDGDDVLITVNGRTWIDTFLRDETDGCYFESYDIDEVEAWMPLPKPYKADSEVE